jgi:hypothetical protein
VVAGVGVDALEAAAQTFENLGIQHLVQRARELAKPSAV